MNTGGWDDREWLMMKLIISNRYLMLKMLIEIISDYMTYVTKNFGEAEIPCLCLFGNTQWWKIDKNRNDEENDDYGKPDVLRIPAGT